MKWKFDFTEDINPELTATVQKATLKMINNIWDSRESALREMLGQWVSELEPCMIFHRAEFDLMDRLIGIGYIGGGGVIIPAPPGTP